MEQVQFWKLQESAGGGGGLFLLARARRQSWGAAHKLGLAFPGAAELPVGPGFQLSPQWLPLSSHRTIQ